MAPQPLVSNPGRFWSGVGFTAVVGGLAALVAVLSVNQIANIDLLYPWPFTTVTAGYVIDAVALTLIGGGLLYLLYQSAPRPRMFFGWIALLATAAIVLVVFSQDVTWETRIGTGSVVAFVALVVVITLSSVSDRTLIPVDRQPVRQPAPSTYPPSTYPPSTGAPTRQAPPMAAPPPWSDNR